MAERPVLVGLIPQAVVRMRRIGFLDLAAGEPAGGVDVKRLPVLSKCFRRPAG